MKKFSYMFLFIMHLTCIFGKSDNLDYYIQKEDLVKLTLDSNTEKRNWNRLGNQSISAGILALTTLSLYIVTDEGNDDFKFDNMLRDWKNNVKKGPSWDKSTDFTNYVAHPYSGAAYYMAARKSNFNRFDSFLYSMTMSTFLWEFGLESIKEPPSIQDLIITPCIGSFLGEVFYNQEKKILKNDNKLLGSKILGKTTMVLMDPIGSLSNLIGLKDKEFIGNYNILFDDNTKKITGIGISFQGFL